MDYEVVVQRMVECSEAVLPESRNDGKADWAPWLSSLELSANDQFGWDDLSNSRGSIVKLSLFDHSNRSRYQLCPWNCHSGQIEPLCNWSVVKADQGRAFDPLLDAAADDRFCEPVRAAENAIRSRSNHFVCELDPAIVVPS